ncbi:hypothetical protein HDK77DRAFT_302314 [Phyllosticta capitalensis]
MNNQDFRKLFARPSAGSPGTNNSSSPSNNASRTPAASLGSRMRSSIPMTPRTVTGGANIDFQRQLAEQRAGGSQPATKKFRSSAAPKGSRLAQGYTDRTQSRVDDEDEADDRAKRIKALEESMKLGQIDQDTFEKLRDQITGGDVSATHLVKGLDRQLLERVRRGEDVLGVGGKPTPKEPSPDVDDEFEQLEQREVAPVVREKAEKKGETALAGTKRTRNEILAELKAQRQAAAAAKAAAQPQLGARFKKVGAHQTETYPRIEIDDRGREVLITLDEDGHIKRKVRKIKAEAESEEKAPTSLPMPDPKAKPLGMEVPEQPKAEEEDDDDDDIFDGVGADYDPLAGLDDDDSSSEEEEGEVSAPAKSKSPSEKPSAENSPESEDPDSTAMPPPPKPAASTSVPKTNYFGDSSSSTAPSIPAPSNPLTDPTILAAIRKAKEIDPDRLRAGDGDSAESAKDPAEEARLKKRAAMLAAQDRDLDDMDMGFGSSRFDDAEEMEEEGTKIKLSEWKGMGGGDDDDDDGAKERGGKKRKRGPKKRKGDKDSAADVLKAMERQKSGGK